MTMRGLAGAILLSVGVFVPQERTVEQAPASAAPPRRPVPTAAGTLAKAPESFYGALVSVTAPVGRMLSASAFVVQDILVIAPTLTQPLDPNTYVTVVGEALRFDPAEIARRVKDYTLDFGANEIAVYHGRPAILATAVVNTALVDLARRPPPPLSAEEAGFDGVMKQIGPTFTTMGTAVAGSDAATVADTAKALRAAFGDAEAFWKARGTADALAWTRSAQAHVTALERAAAAGNWDQVKTSAGELGRMCQTCHTAYRERLEDGTYRLKLGAPSR